MRCLALAIVITLAAGGSALADPCEAPVTGYEVGQSFAGKVQYIGDGDMVCVGSSSNPKTWIEVRLADFYAPELNAAGGQAAKRALIKIAQGSQVVCRVEAGRNGRTFNNDRVIAVCWLGGRSLGDAMRRAGIPEGGNGR